MIKIKKCSIDNNGEDPLVCAEVQGTTDVYNVTLFLGLFNCTCDDFYYRSRFGDFLENEFKGISQDEQYKCKHIRALERYLKRKKVLK